MRRIAMFFVALILEILAVRFCFAQQSTTPDGRLLNFGQKFSLRVPAPWIESPIPYSNAQEFLIRGDTQVSIPGQPTLQQADTPLARAHYD
jgi:hypothetical protein